MPKAPVLTCAVSTWNVGAADMGTTSKAAGVDGWLRVTGNAPADLHIVALQEVVDINSPLSYLSPLSTFLEEQTLDGLGEATSEGAAVWEAALRTYLPSHVLVARKQLVGIILFVFVGKQHAASCTSARVTQLGTGPLGAGNKGAVAASLGIYGSTACFVCSHLAAGSKGPSGRNKDMETLRDGLAFPPTEADSSPATATTAPPTSLEAHDIVIWCGDLNYRLEMKDEDARALAAQSDWSTMLAADELRQNAASGGVWAAFEEGKIGFPPTYKYDLNSDEYDTSSKRRAPAWTDRILWKRGSQVATSSYTRHELRESDHRPVSALLQLTVKPLPSAGRLRRPSLAAPNPCAALSNCLRTIFKCCKPTPPEGYEELVSKSE